MSAESTCRWITAVHLTILSPVQNNAGAFEERSSKLRLPYTADLPKYSYYSAFTLRTSKMGNSQANDAINDIDAWWLLVYACMQWSMVALLVWEYLLTLGREVELIWMKKGLRSTFSILLVSTRICMLVSAALAVGDNLPPASCLGYRLVTIAVFIVSIVSFIQTALFSALRAAALYNRNLKLFFLILLLGLAPVPTNLFSISHSKTVDVEGACITFTLVSAELEKTLVLVTRIPLIIADLLVLVLTWIKTYHQIRELSFAGVRTSLSTCLLRDGTLYFLCLLGINILQIAAGGTRLSSPLSTLAAMLPLVLINRFMLDLRSVDSSTFLSCSTGPFPNMLSTVPFPSQLSDGSAGIMGESLDYGTSSTYSDSQATLEGCTLRHSPQEVEAGDDGDYMTPLASHSLTNVV